MKLSPATFLTLVCALVFPWSTRAADPQPDAGGIVIEPHDGLLETDEVFTITFPTAMVKEEAINSDGNAAPFTITPKLAGTFLWKSQTEGQFTVTGAVIPAEHYKFALDPALKDLTGAAVKVKAWGAEFTTQPFHFTNDNDSDSGNTDHLSSSPEVYLSSSYLVHYSEAAEHIYFQDRESHLRQPAEVVVSSDKETDADKEAGIEFRVRPREELPVGRTFDLIIDGVRELKNQRPLPYIQVFQLGSTRPMKVKWVGAFNHPVDPPQIVVTLDDRIDPHAVTADTWKIEPAVANKKVSVADDSITINGDFDPHTRYSVIIPASLKGERGYGLEADSKWGATFKPKNATVVFPGKMIFERAGRGLRFSFLQINAPKLTWKLAVIPPEKLAAVSGRVREFEENAVDPFTGEQITDPDTDAGTPKPTDLLVDAFDLKTAVTGEFDATDGDKQVQRDINTQAAGGAPLTGAYLLEVSGTDAGGHIVGNRSIVCFSDLILTQKRTDTSVIVRVAKMSDGQPVPDMPVTVVSEQNAELGRAVSDKNGFATFPRSLFSYTQNARAQIFIAETPGGPALQYVDATAYTSGSPIDRPSTKSAAGKPAGELRSVIITDRNLYRPSQMVKIKGFLRISTNEELSIPAGKPVHWWITQGSRDETLGEGQVPLSEDGGWTAEWEIPAKATLGEYTLHCEAADLQTSSDDTFQVDEYRVPLFSTVVEAENKVGPFSQVKVSSAYFHGAANRDAHVHWKATWFTLETGDTDEESTDANTPAGSDLGFFHFDKNTDRNPKPAREPEGMKVAEGDATLDANGMAEIKCDSPFTDGALRGRCSVTWKVDVTSIDGQTLTGGVTQALQFVRALPGIKAAEQSDGYSVKVAFDAIDVDGKPADGLELSVDLFHVTDKTAKEKIAPFVYRYRNTTIYTKVATQTAKAPGSLVFPVKDTGRYVAVATATNQEQTPLVSDEAYVSGEAQTEFPVQNETALQITHDDKKFVPGETAVLHTQAPFGGVAWVTVEADEILDTMLVPLPGNSGRIELPIKKEYGPNAFVSVYLVKPGGKEDLAQERFAYTNIEVRIPEQELNIVTQLEKNTVRPGDPVRGGLTVKSNGNPVKDADVTVFAVDDAVLQLGSWSLPEIGPVFYAQRHFGVMTYSALENYIAEIKRDSLSEKGFVIGGGGEEGFEHITTMRKEFKTLAFWEGSLKTDDDGKIKFEFKAPDNLTTYRIVAVGETQKNQFGGDSTATVKISKPLIAEPALSRFLRDGDEVELRVVVRQNFADNDEITVRCVPDARLQLTDPAEATQKAAKDAPAVFRFKAKVVDADFTPTVLRFDAVSKSNKEAYDSVQNTLPVNPPVIVRKETVAGTFQGPAFDAVQKIPDAWKKGHGTYDLTVSTSPWLPKITGLPYILDYPHGCFDQISSRMLSYAMLGDLLAYLPNAESRETSYRASIENGLKLFNQSVMENGMLPYWNGETDGSPFCTVEACWALSEIEKAGFKIPEELPDKISKAVNDIARGKIKSDPFTQCYALMVLGAKSAHGHFNDIAQDLYSKRNMLDDESRAMLALALHQFNIMPKEKAQLMSEINVDNLVKERAFDPSSFSSTARDQAIRFLAFCRIAPSAWTKERKEKMKDQLMQMMDSSLSLSTQENLWLLLAFKAFQDSENLPKLEINKDLLMRLSKNGASAGWQNITIQPPLKMSIGGLNTGVPLSYLMAAEYMTDQVDTDREQRGFHMERVVKNLTDPKRVGTAEAPFKLGDQILITYRVFTHKLQNYVALEDQLPAGLETTNPDLPMIGKFYTMPPDEPGVSVLPLSHSEMRDQSTLLYFDTINPGISTYSVLARATVAGTFRWPSTQIAPMYDSRFSGLSPSSLCVVSGE